MTPAATRVCTFTGSFMSRIVLVTWEQLHAVDVLQQRVPEHGVVRRVPDDRRHGVQPRRASGTQATLTHDELVGAVTVLTDDDRLEQTELLDAVGQLLERLVVEDLPRLLRVRDDLENVPL